MGKSKVYSEMLEEIFSEYKGEHEDLLSKIPLFFNLLQDIYPSLELNWESKFKINSCFSYFAVPVDVIPDEGAMGFLDDLYVCVYVLDQLTVEYPELIKKCWDKEGDILEMIKESLEKTEKLLGNQCSSILTFTGLLKFNEMSRSMALLKAPRDANEKVDRLKEEIQNLISMMRTIFISERKKPNNHKLRGLKELFSKKEWDGVVRILENIEIYESKYDNTHELELEKIRRKIVLEIDEDLLDE